MTAVVSGLTYTIQTSSDLATWTDTPVSRASLTPGEPHTFTDPTDLSSANPTKRFLRIRVSAP